MISPANPSGIPGARSSLPVGIGLSYLRRSSTSAHQHSTAAAMARDAGFHQAKHWVDAELGYAPSDPVEPETELAKLLREYIEIEQRRSQLQPKIEEQRAKLRAI